MALSPDLGNIQVDGNVRVPSPSSVDVFGPLADIGASIAQNVNEDRIERHQEELQQAADKGVAQVEAIRNDTLATLPPTTGDEAADAVIARMYALQDGVLQATGSRRDVMAQQLRAVSAEFARNYPNLRDQFGSQLRGFLSVNPEVAALDAFDRANAEDLKNQTRDLDKLKDYAINTLGMAPHINIASIDGAKEFAKRDFYVQAKKTNDQILQAQESQQNLDIDSHIETFVNGFQGDASEIMMFRNETGEILDQLSQDMSKIASDPAALARVEAWKNGGQAVMLRRLDQLQFELFSRFNQIPARFVDNEKYASAKALYAEQRDALAELVKGLETNTPSLVDTYSAYNTSQLIKSEQNAPVFTGQLRLLKHWAPAFEIAKESFDQSGMFAADAMGKIMANGLMDIIGRDAGFTKHNELSINSPAQAIEDHYKSTLTANPDPYKIGRTGRPDTQRAILSDIQGKQSPVYRAMAVDAQKTPEVAEAMVGGSAQRYVHLNQLGTVPAQGLEIIRDDWVHTGILDNLKIVAENGPNPETVDVLVDNMETLASQYVDVREEFYRDTLGKRAGRNLRLGAGISHVDGSDIKNGNVKLVVDQSAILAANPTGTTRVAGLASTAIRQAEKEAAKLSARLSRDLKAAAHQQAARDGSFVPNYKLTWEIDFAVVVGDLDGSE